MREFKVVVLGSGGVGKSALTVQFVSGCFIEKYDPTIEDFYRKEIEVSIIGSFKIPLTDRKGLCAFSPFNFNIFSILFYFERHLTTMRLIYWFFLSFCFLGQMQVDNSPCVLEILDTAGTEQFASMRDLYIKNGHGFIVMYSLTNHQTFQVS